MQKLCVVLGVTMLLFGLSSSIVRHSDCIMAAFLWSADYLDPELSESDYYVINGGDITCLDGYAMNVKHSEYMTFRCKIGTWQAYDRYAMEIKDFTLKDLTCEEKVPCVNPRMLSHGSFSVKERYCLEVPGVSRCTGTFFNGDKIQYQCKQGYKPRPVKVESNDNDNDNYMYVDGYGEGSYDTYGGVDEFTLKTPNLEFTCDDKGSWGNGDSDEFFPICDQILCDAGHFANMSNGYVKNFTEKYAYGEKLELVCDEGYTPIHGRHHIMCLDPETFPTQEEFGCQKVECPAPVDPIGGQFFSHNATRTNVGDVIEFVCHGYKTILSGPRTLTCMANGEWSSDVCTLCIPPDADCPPPCMRSGLQVLTEPTYSRGSVIELSCKENQDVRVSRTCLVNNRWNGSELICNGRPDPSKAMMVASSLQIAMGSLQNHTLGDDGGEGIVAKSIKVGQPGGVEIYFAIDVSGSIQSSEFDNLKKFTIALTRHINVSPGADGTKLAFYAFASETVILYNGHSTSRTDKPFKDTEEAVRTIEDTLNLENIRGGEVKGQRVDIGQGTDITRVINDVIIDVNTKKATSGAIPQQVLIIISDGAFTKNGDPTSAAEKLKSLDVQIYSIFVGIDGRNAEQTQSVADKDVMKRIASDLPGEQHYFEVHDGNFYRTIQLMVNSNLTFDCGWADPQKTLIGNNDVKKVQKTSNSFEHAWPWMVQIHLGKKKKGKFVCGGSLVDKKHILTAAHCFYQNNTKITDPITVILKAHNTSGHEDEVISQEVDISSVKIHESFDQSVKPTFLFDIALVPLPNPIVYEINLRQICLPEDDRVFDNMHKRPNTTYGVVTGWGGNRTVLHQAQMLIPDNESCIRNINDDHKTEFDNRYMLCAGGQDQNEAVDSCVGDSGGPLVIENVGKENTFIQIGIVSFSFGKCKQKGRYGFYTKLNAELVKWINVKSASVSCDCGLADPQKTLIGNNDVKEVQKMRESSKHAWPWMVQIKRGKIHVCGGSLVDKKHILTAAHCFYLPWNNTKITDPITVILKAHKTSGHEEGVISQKVELSSIKIHESFDQSVKPTFLFDIALVTLPYPIVYDFNLRKICLPGDDRVFESIHERPNATYGVVTGWGGNRDVLHQAQMLIPDNESCIRNINDDHKTEFDNRYMLCAGGQDQNQAVDSCKGDSGGPLVIENVGKEHTFIQIGISSFSSGECKQKGRYGFYTKLNAELVKWIKDTIKTDEDKAE